MLLAVCGLIRKLLSADLCSLFDSTVCSLLFVRCVFFAACRSMLVVCWLLFVGRSLLFVVRGLLCVACYVFCVLCFVLLVLFVVGGLALFVCLLFSEGC